MGLAPTLRVVVLTHSAAANTWLSHLCAGCVVFFGQALQVLIVVIALASSLVLDAALLSSGSTSILLSHVAFTRQDVYVQFCASRGVLTTDVYLAVALLLYSYVPV